MALDRPKWLRITLMIIALDYTLVGIGSILLPEWFNPSGNVQLAYNLISISVGLFAFVMSWDTEKYQDFLWVLVIQEIGVIFIHIYQIVAEIPDLFMNVIIAFIHLVYILAIIFLGNRSIIPSFAKSSR